MNIAPNPFVRAASVFAFSVLAFLPIGASTANAEPLDKAEIEKIVREYLISNPEILIEMQQAYEVKQRAELVENQKVTLQEKQAAIYQSPHEISIGDPNADITIVEFFDYNCGFCKRALDDMNRLIASDRSIRFILKEYPVLGEGSLTASQVSVAFSKLYPEKYSEFHRQLLSLDGPKDGERAIETAVANGADRDTLVGRMKEDDILDALRESYEIAEGLGINGTPSYIIGDKVVFGAVGFDQLEQDIDAQFQSN